MVKENSTSISRKSNIELLRIFAILMVLTLHYLNPNMGGALKEINKGDTYYYVIKAIESFSIIAVNLFIIISGYFMVNSKKVSLSKIVNLALLAYFYGVILYLFSVIIGKSNFGYGELIRSFNISLSGGYWFIQSYIILYLLSPYINIMLNNINKKNHEILIIISLLFFSIWPSFFDNAPKNDSGYGIITFIILYIIGNYIRRYFNSNKNFIHFFSVYVLCSIITTIAPKLNLKGYWDYNFIFNIIGAISLFMAFIKLDIKAKWINKISTFVFAVYIIHVNPYISKFLYIDILKCNLFYNSKYFIFHMILSILFIFILCLLIEVMRRYLITIIIKILKKVGYRKKDKGSYFIEVN
ncbi:acyltransferase [Paraclostridium bifermentans]|uniref:acyltransferase n=1 Tax=Paraclostridium bifermentans TaxID=1490 RepID=UPI00189FCB4B|nr:acyltransferase [Paraclostridium bifermentans]